MKDNTWHGIGVLAAPTSELEPVAFRDDRGRALELRADAPDDWDEVGRAEERRRRRLYFTGKVFPGGCSAWGLGAW